jgi:hypothetical protein
LAGAISYWSIFVSIAITTTLYPERLDLPTRVPNSRQMRHLLSSVRGRQVRYQDLPCLWRSPWATTIRRLRVAALLMGVVIMPLVLSHKGVSHGDFALVAYVADVGVLSTLSFAVPIMIVDNTRRRIRGHESATVAEGTGRIWVRQVLSLVLGVVLLTLTGVILVDRLASVLDHPTSLVGHGSTTVQLAASTQTIYTGCNDNLQCSPLAVANIRVVNLEDHESVPVVPDIGVDHESFHEHPWLSVANFTVATKARYLISLGGRPNGEYALSLSQLRVLHVIAPILVTAILRLIGLGLGIAALRDLATIRRRRYRRSASTHSE